MRLNILKLTLLILMLPLFSGTAQVKKLSETAKISLLTCGPGEAIWSKYGHSALWVFDTTTGIDRVYNYGTFDFYSNSFYTEFIKGTAQYRLSITDYLNFHKEYESENRSIIMQELNLTLAEKQLLFEKLQENYLPENRYYRYDFLFQNCSSLIRDIVWETTGGRYTIPDTSEEKHTFRSMMKPYLREVPWLRDGEFILLGYKTDHDANPWDQMYLPDYMFSWFDAARNAENESLVKETHTLFLPVPDGRKNIFLTHPSFILSIIVLLLLWLTYREMKGKKAVRIIDSVFLLVFGLFGILMTYMWCCSLHEVTHQNMNLFWAFPLHFIAGILVWIKKAAHIIRIYSKIMAPVSILFLMFFWLLPQAIPGAAVFASAITGIILVKYGYLIREKK